MNTGNFIEVIGASENNLEGVTLNIPKHQLVLLTGPTGAGKSSLAISTLAAYHTYRLGVLGKLIDDRLKSNSITKPGVFKIKGLPPVVTLSSGTFKNSRETIASFLDLPGLCALSSEVACPHCGVAIRELSAHSIQLEIEKRYCGHMVELLVPLNLLDVREAGDLMAGIEGALDLGFSEFRFGSRLFCHDAIKPFERAEIEGLQAKHGKECFVVIDRLKISAQKALRLEEGVERALAMAQGVIALMREGSIIEYFSPDGVCSRCCYRSFRVPSKSRDFRLGCSPDQYQHQPSELLGFSTLPEEQLKAVLAVKRGSVSLIDLLGKSFASLSHELTQMSLEGVDPLFVRTVSLLCKLGLSHLLPLRALATLSSGEAHRILLAQTLLKQFVDTLLIIDDFGRGLHGEDLLLLIEELKEWCGRRNTVILVSQDSILMDSVDYIITLGLGVSGGGGKIVSAESSCDLERGAEREDLQGISNSARSKKKLALSFMGASLHNLRGVSADIPSGALTCVSGVSGSGKSALVMKTLLPALRELKQSGREGFRAEDFALQSLEADLRGLKIVEYSANERPQGGGSMVVVFLGIFEKLSKTLSLMEGARVQGFTAKTFALRGKESGRCRRCQGEGYLIEDSAPIGLNQLCPHCDGARYEPAALRVLWKGFSIADMLEMSFVQASSLLRNLPKVSRALALIDDLKLSYLLLGQSVASLSQGEWQGLSLVKVLLQGGSKSIHLMEQPAAGLGREEASYLAKYLKRVCVEGSTIIVAENNPYFIDHADYLLELPGRHSTFLK